jgi:F420-dependent oxidoreductase-like protein
MRIGIMHGTDGPDADLDGLVRVARRIESLGFSTLWMPNIFSFDAITALAILGRETERIELGTAVVPTYPRHPMAIAQQALTASAATKGRFTLGIGLSHKIVIEDMFGMSYDKPARHMKEYLEVLTPLLRGEPVKFAGDLYRVQGGIQVPGAEVVPLVVAALGPVMLGHTGRLTDGTITWMTGPQTLENHIIPSLAKAAQKAGRGAPRVVAGLPIALTNEPDAARETMGKVFAMYGQLPSYRAMLDREGVEGPAGVGMVGDEAELRRQIGRLRDIGVTDFDAAIAPVEEGAYERTLDFLATLT